MNYFVIKRLFDYAISLVGLLIFSPVAILIAFLIFIEDGLPIFYVKKALGIYGEIFKVYKFRSMKKNSLAIIKTGKIIRAIAMDELPQLLIIAKGQMSFVGPRPYGIDKYGITENMNVKKIMPQALKSDKSAFAERLSVTPGLTGMAQVFVPKHASNGEVLEWDLKYIKERSLILDLYIFLLSIYVTFKRGWEKAGKKL